MSDRSEIIAGFIAGSPWADWQHHPIAADASARSYIRLTPKTGAAYPVILMNAPPESGENTRPFANITNLLRDGGFAAPEILHHDAALGIMVLEDLGPNDFARWIAQNPSDSITLYSTAADVLVKLSQIPAPDNLPVMNASTGGEMVGITAQWYAQDVDGKGLINAVRDHLERLTTEPTVIALRDFHAENLIWRPQLDGLNRVGLLDYQDAFVAPTGYDLASLLRDARRDVDTDITDRIIAHFAKTSGIDPAKFQAQFACLSAQRNLRILGVFARLIRRDGKQKYLQFVPRVWSHIQTDLAHPALAKLRDVVNETLPLPNASTLKDLI